MRKTSLPFCFGAGSEKCLLLVEKGKSPIKDRVLGWSDSGSSAKGGAL